MRIRADPASSLPIPTNPSVSLGIAMHPGASQAILTYPDLQILSDPARPILMNPNESQRGRFQLPRLRPRVQVTILSFPRAIPRDSQRMYKRGGYNGGHLLSVSSCEIFSLLRRTQRDNGVRESNRTASLPCEVHNGGVLMHRIPQDRRRAADNGASQSLSALHCV